MLSLRTFFKNIINIPLLTLLICIFKNNSKNNNNNNNNHTNQTPNQTNKQKLPQNIH